MHLREEEFQIYLNIVVNKVPFNLQVPFNLYAFGRGILWPQFIDIMQLDCPELISGRMLMQ